MAIKNFKAPIRKQPKSQADAILVSNYMTTKLITFRPDQPVLEVMELLIKNRISGGPVVNEKNQLLGIISEGDCMKQISESRYYDMPMHDETVDKYMAVQVDTIHPDTTIFELATRFYASKRKRYPVLSKTGELVGQISRRDVLKAALALKEGW
jgi:CBS domain-containing protein